MYQKYNGSSAVLFFFFSFFFNHNMLFFMMAYNLFFSSSLKTTKNHNISRKYMKRILCVEKTENRRRISRENKWRKREIFISMRKRSENFFFSLSPNEEELLHEIYFMCRYRRRKQKDVKNTVIRFLSKTFIFL